MVMYANEFKNKRKPKINWNKKLTATATPALMEVDNDDNVVDIINCVALY